MLSSDQIKSQDYSTEITSETNPDAWKHHRNRQLEKEELMKIYANLDKYVFPEPGQKFLVVIYLLQESSPTTITSEKIIPVNGIHGIIFPVSVHATYPQAEEKAKELCQRYGVDLCRIYPMAEWRYIAEEAPASQVKYIPSESDVTSLQTEHHQKKVEAFKQEVKLQDKIQEEHLRSDQPGTVEHYTYSWYRAIKHRAQMEYLETKLASTKENFQKEVQQIQSDYQKDPSLDERWLSPLEEKLHERQEGHIYSAIVSGYEKLRAEILPKDN